MWQDALSLEYTEGNVLENGILLLSVDEWHNIHTLATGDIGCTVLSPNFKIVGTYL
jgi:hypothetical protein